MWVVTQHRKMVNLNRSVRLRADGAGDDRWFLYADFYSGDQVRIDTLAGPFAIGVAQEVFEWLVERQRFSGQDSVADLRKCPALAAPARERITTEDGKPPGESDTWVCVCGNTASMSGFQPCLRNGVFVEPTVTGPWDGKLYRCDGCTRIIDQSTGEVIGFAA